MGPPIDTERWCAASMPYSWLPAARPAQRAPHAVSTCELEADCVAPDILNRTYAIRQPLSSAGARVRSSSANPPLSRNCAFSKGRFQLLYCFLGACFVVLELRGGLCMQGDCGYRGRPAVGGEPAADLAGGARAATGV